MNIQISGNLSKPTIIFIAGWPDTCDVFRDNLMAALAADYRIVGVTLPGFDDEHPFLKELRRQYEAETEKEWEKQRHGSKGSPSASAATGSKWNGLLSPVRFFSSAVAALRSDGTSGMNRQACRVTPLNSFGLPNRCSSLEPFRTSWRGHSFQDLMTLLEVAVDTAMETCNYCPHVVPSTAAETHANARHNDACAGETETSERSTNDFAAHQLPPTYTRPVLIAHGWGCFLAYELLLARPGLFSRIVALDVGAYYFESDAAHVERMCALLSDQEKGEAAVAADRSLAAASTHASLQKKRADESASSGPVVAATTQTRVTHATKSTSPELGVPAIGAAPTVTLAQGQISSTLGAPSTSETVAHCVGSCAPFDGPKVLLTPPQLHSGLSSPGTKRSLASQYAIRQRRGVALPQGAETFKRLFIVLSQSFLIACEFLVPYRLARWLLGCFASLAGRPSYSYDPQMVATPAMELLNHTLNAQFFARHPSALENRGALHVPMLLQTQEASRCLPSPAAAAALKASRSSNKGSSQPMTLGWKIMLIPYVEKMPVSVFPTTPFSGIQSPLHSNGGRTASGHWPLDSAEAGEAFEGKCGRFQKPSQSRRARRYSLHGVCSTESFASAGSMGNAAEGGGGADGRVCTCEGQRLSDGAHVVCSSYTKGAHMVFDEWNSLTASTRGIFGGGRSGICSSGEHDPYTPVNGITLPIPATEDPLTLTGAQSFVEVNKPADSEGEEDFLSMAADGTLARGGGHADVFAVSYSGGAGQIHVAKRRLFYQAIVFPPVNIDADGPSLTSFHDDVGDSMSRPSSAAPNTTVMSRACQSNRAPSVCRSVSVCPSPSQSWIYLRYWLGTCLLSFVSLVSRLLGEKQPTPPWSSQGNGSASSSACRAPRKVSSNVMTTAMTTIYRRLPATPSLAADVSTLPGNGDIVLKPKSYAPLVTQRFFVPLPIPILFMYGGEKRVMFHADHWCSYIRQYQRPRDGISDVVEVHGGGHWFFAEKKYQKKVADRIAEFIAAEAKTPYRI
ncbi:hypothetical protein JIQ42_00513 [Leishmania sp. Namibia]|uniref:hypothetical protein n=1 Tax=Leishmania sp. Namibia TaxID=2802991 RepID=UPI001B40F79C|nr:hypothetical protein JIQ42_00513 [Leishmania sp. Namibia]